MMAIRATSWKELIRKLRTLGFEGPYSGGKYQFMKKGTLKLRVPNPHQRDVSVDLLRRILRQADISPQEWEEA